jgi:phage shock protein C
MQKKLYRSRTNKSISGVCGGLGEYLNMDPSVVRVLWVLISIFVAGFPGLIAYVIMAAVIPEAPEQPEAWQQPYQQPYAPPQQNWQQPPPQGAWQAPPPPPTAQPVDYTQPAPPEAPPAEPASSVEPAPPVEPPSE